MFMNKKELALHQKINNKAHHSKLKSIYQKLIVVTGDPVEIVKVKYYDKVNLK